MITILSILGKLISRYMPTVWRFFNSWTCILLIWSFILGIHILNHVGCSPPERQKEETHFTIKTDQLMASRTFALYAKKGVFKEFDPTGKLIESKNVNDFQNGELRWTITGTNTALTFGNVGSEEVELIRGDRSLTFIETTPVGNQMILIIYDEWSEKEKGFRCVYTRNLESGILLPTTLRTVYSGIAKID